MVNENNFYDRSKELNELKEKYDELDYGELCVLLGRRRLGKTAFIKKFMRQTDCNKVYYFVNKTNKTELLNLLSDSIFEQTGEREKFSDWEDFFHYLYKSSKDKKFVFVMDEFSRLKDTSPEFITKFQDYWDSNLKNTKLMFIAIGSSMSMMHDIFMDKTAPLYGRITWKMTFRPFRYVDFREMFKELNEEKRIKIYSIFGGTPHYLWFVKKRHEKDMMDLISRLVLSNTGPLREEPSNLITMELSRERNYNSILHAISSTDGSKNEITSHSGVSKKDVDYYINNLISLLSIVEKFKPIFYNKRNSIRYKFTDNFFNFWYRFIFPNQSLIELGNLEKLNNKIKTEMDSFIGARFEEIIKELFILYNGKKIKQLDINFDDIGPWWGYNREGNTEEIDLVANNKTDKKTISCEIKWTNKPIDVKEAKELDRKSRLINVRGEINYLFVSKSGFTPRCLEFMDEKNMTHLDLKEIERLFEDSS